MNKIAITKRPTEVIAAIKGLREHTNWGLLEARKAIDSPAFKLDPEMDVHVARRVVDVIRSCGGEAYVEGDAPAPRPRKRRMFSRQDRLALYRCFAMMSAPYDSSMPSFSGVLCSSAHKAHVDKATRRNDEAWAAEVERRARAVLSAESKPAKKQTKE